MSHVDEGLLHAWLDGELDERRAGELEEHVALCKRCDALLEETIRVHARSGELMAAAGIGDAEAPAWSEIERRAQDAAAREAETAAAAGSPESAPSFLVPGLAWAATLVLAFFLGWQASHRSALQGPEITVEARPAPAVGAAEADERAGARFEAAEKLADAPQPAAASPAEAAAPVANARAARLMIAAEGSAEQFRVISPRQARSWLGVVPLRLPTGELRAAAVGPADALPGIPGRPVVRMVYDVTGVDAPVVVLQQSVEEGDEVRLLPIPETVELAPMPRAAAAPSADRAEGGQASRLAALPDITFPQGLAAAVLTVRPDGSRSLRWLDPRGYLVVIEGELTEARLRQLAASLEMDSRSSRR